MFVHVLREDSRGLVFRIRFFESLRWQIAGLPSQMAHIQYELVISEGVAKTMDALLECCRASEYSMAVAQLHIQA
jgi:hypothetical protein